MDTSIAGFRDRVNHRAAVAAVALPELAPEPALKPAPLTQSRFVSVIAERDGRIVGVRVMEMGGDRRALPFYARLGYVVREALACIQGPALGLAPRGHVGRAARESDVESCNRLCRRIYGYDRDRELRDAATRGTARVIERHGRVTGYATAIGFFGHAVGEDNEDLQALIGSADAFAGPGFLLPTRNTGLLRWCLEHGLRVVQPLTLMSRGAYREPAGAFLPSILY
jgi:hypothetical protein